MEASELAGSLAAAFLENGNYEALGTSLNDSDFLREVGPANLDGVDEYFQGESGFAGLSVQSVGFTKGAEEEEVIIYVTRGSKKALRDIPSEIEDVPVRAQVMGKLRVSPSAVAAGLSNFYEKGNRIACGSSVAPSSVRYAGTLGAFARRGNELFALSNNHVFADCNHTPIGMPILAPAARDAKAGRRAPTEVSIYESMIELRSGIPSLVPTMQLDAAIGRVRTPDLITSWQGDDINGYDTPANVADPSAGMRVKKFGRTTGFTIGEIEAFVPTPWVITYKHNKFTADVWFQDTWTVRSIDADPFALGGDSGSLVVTEDGTAALGLIFAASPSGQYGIFCSMEPILQLFGNLNLLHNYEV